MAETRTSTLTRPDDVARLQQTALLDTTLSRIIRYAQLMQADLRKDELNLAYADQLGHSVLTVVREAAAIGTRAEMAAREKPPAVVPVFLPARGAA